MYSIRDPERSWLFIIWIRTQLPEFCHYTTRFSSLIDMAHIKPAIRPHILFWCALLIGLVALFGLCIGSSA